MTDAGDMTTIVDIRPSNTHLFSSLAFLPQSWRSLGRGLVSSIPLTVSAPIIFPSGILSPYRARYGVKVFIWI